MSSLQSFSALNLSPASHSLYKSVAEPSPQTRRQEHVSSHGFSICQGSVGAYNKSTAPDSTATGHMRNEEEQEVLFTCQNN